MRNRRAALGILLLGLLVPCGCSTPQEEPGGRREAGSGPVQTFQNLELRETSEGKLEWILRARRAVRSSANEPTRLESLRVDFYQRTERIRSSLTSDSGLVNPAKGTLVARGNVVVLTPDGNRLETEELCWDRKSSLVSSEREVKLVRKDDILTGIGFQSDPNLVNYEIRRDVRALVHEQSGIRDEILGADSGRVGN